VTPIYSAHAERSLSRCVCTKCPAVRCYSTRQRLISGFYRRLIWSVTMCSPALSYRPTTDQLYILAPTLVNDHEQPIKYYYSAVQLLQLNITLLLKSTISFYVWLSLPSFTGSATLTGKFCTHWPTSCVRYSFPHQGTIAYFETYQQTKKMISWFRWWWRSSLIFCKARLWVIVTESGAWLTFASQIG